MASHPRAPRSRGDRRGRRFRPSLLPLENRVVPALTFPGIGGITFDASGDVFVSYDSTTGLFGPATVRRRGRCHSVGPERLPAARKRQHLHDHGRIRRFPAP